MVWARLSMADLARCARTCREFAAHVRELRASKRAIVLPSGMLPRTLGAACKEALLFVARALLRTRTCQDGAAYMQELRLPCAQSCCRHAISPCTQRSAAYPIHAACFLFLHAEPYVCNHTPSTHPQLVLQALCAQDLCTVESSLGDLHFTCPARMHEAGFYSASSRQQFRFALDQRMPAGSYLVN